MLQDSHQSREPSFFLSDSPINGLADDKLGRASFAQAVAQQVATAPAKVGFAVGLVGPWGSGKTSLLRMIEDILSQRRDVVILHFNPWLFAGTEQLVDRFFGELSAKLAGQHDERLRSLASRIEAYGERLESLKFLPVVGRYVSVARPASRVAGEQLRRRARFHGKGTDDRRREIDHNLRSLDKRLVVTIDDIDRLGPGEIRDIMRLVRLVADFPQTVYILAFDRTRVEESLDEGVPGRGRDYLAKILQVTHDVPSIREPDLSEVLTTELEQVIAGQDVGPFDVVDWQNVFHFVIRPLFKTIRDVRRFLNALPVELAVLGDEVALVDVLALEAIRVMCPDAFVQLATLIEPLTNVNTEQTFDQGRRDQIRARLEELCASGSQRSAAIRAMLTWLFPASRRYFENHYAGAESAKRWRRDRRVAHAEVLRFYLEKSLPKDAIETKLVKDLFVSLGDRERLSQLLNSMEAGQLENALQRLEDYENDYPASCVSVAVPVLMGQLSRLREERNGIADFGAETWLERIVVRLLRRVEGESERAKLVSDILSDIGSLSARWRVIRVCGSEQRDGSPWLSKGEVVTLEDRLRANILASTAAILANERDLAQLLTWCSTTGGSAATARTKELIEDDAVFLRLLRSATSEGFAQGFGTAAVRKVLQLPWDWLTSVLGEDLLRQRTQQVIATIRRPTLDQRTAAALTLAAQLASGQPPEQL